MKLKKIIAAIAASALAVSAMTVSASATLADNQKAYGFGGAQVGWDIDVDGDEEADIIGGANGDQWIGNLDPATGAGQIKIPCTAGDTIAVTCASWETITDKPIFTITVDGTAYDCYYNQPVTITVPDSVQSTLTADIQWAVVDETQATDGNFNDWCGNYVVVTAGGAAAADTATDAGADTTTAPATGNVPAAVMVSVMAAAGAAVVASRKRK